MKLDLNIRCECTFKSVCSIWFLKIGDMSKSICVCVCSRVIWFQVGNKNLAMEHKQLTLWKRNKNAMEKCKIKIPSPNKTWTCNWSTSPPENLTTHIMWSTYIHCKSRAKNRSILLLFNPLFVSQKSPRANSPLPHPTNNPPTHLHTHPPTKTSTNSLIYPPTYQSLYQPISLPNTYLPTHPPNFYLPTTQSLYVQKNWCNTFCGRKVGTNPHYLSHNSCPFAI